MRNLVSKTDTPSQLDNKCQLKGYINLYTASGAWQVASIAYTASKLPSENGIFMKSACNISQSEKDNQIPCTKHIYALK